MINDTIRILFFLLASVCLVHAQQRPFDTKSSKSGKSGDYRSSSIEIHQSGSYNVESGYAGSSYASAVIVNDKNGRKQGFVYNKVTPEKATAGKNYEQLLASLSYQIEINDDFEMED